MTKILIAVDGSERSEDAIAFGRNLAVAAGAPVVLAMARQARLREELDGALARLAAGLADVDDVEVRPLVGDTSPAHALQEAAEEEQAGLIWSARATRAGSDGSCLAAPPSDCSTGRRAQSPS